MSSSDLENNDLQTYLDSFNKEIEEDGEEVEENKVQIDCVQADGTDEEKDGESTYFMDQVGNYYYQATESPKTFTKSNQSKKHSFSSHNKDRSKEVIPNKKTPTDADDNNAGESDEEMDYVLILDNATGKEIDPNELDPDDPGKEIYDFDENDEVNDDNPSNSEETQVRTNVVRLKPNSTDAASVTHSCLHCDYTTEKRYLLSRHLRAHSDDRPYRCSVCERGFKSNASLLNHLNSHLGNKPHHCKSCEMAFTTSGELVRHVRYKHTLEKPHKCTECDYASVELSKLKRHMRCHTGERPYQCPHCTYASPDTFKLKRHMRTHTGEKPYECDICHARFTQSNSMKAHRMIHSVGAKPVFQCSLCPTTCGRKTDLRIHIQKLHHSEEPINCKRCGKSFPDRYSYKVHIKTHEGEKCYRCNICPYASISLRHLESHMLIHTDQKPFVCNICEMSFRQKQLLKRHINLYHDKLYVPPTPREKRHTCPDCNRSFSHKGNLMRHMELHDPDSNLKQEKLKLKLGRNTRVSADGSIEVLGSGNEMETEEYYDGEGEYYEGTEEEFEIIEMVEDELEEQKPVVQNSLLNIPAEEPSSSKNLNEVLTDIKTVSIKKEPDGKEFVAVAGPDGKQYMVVEVIHCGDEDDDSEAIVSTMEEHSNEIIANANKTDVDNYFGFEEAEDEEYVDDSDNKETIQLLEIIDDE